MVRYRHFVSAITYRDAATAKSDGIINCAPCAAYPLRLSFDGYAERTHTHTYTIVRT